MQKQALIIGGNSGIGSAVLEKFRQRNDITHIVSVNREASEIKEKVTQLTCSHTNSDIIKTTEQLKQLGLFDYIVICNGILHNQQITPEKRLEDIGHEKLALLFNINSIIPMLWLQNLPSVFTSSTVIAVLSARVGSIEDNHLGGWYGYRASKAALNMLIKTTAIEYARRYPKVKLLAFHPGTTDTQLSKPFQAKVPKGKLFTPEFVATSLLNIMETRQQDGKAEFIDWQGKHIPW